MSESWTAPESPAEPIEQETDLDYAMGLEDVSRLRFTLTTIEDETLGVPQIVRLTGKVVDSGGWNLSIGEVGTIINTGTLEIPRYELAVLVARERSNACSYHLESVLLHIGSDGTLEE